MAYASSGGFPSFSNGYMPATSTLAEITANLVVNYGRNDKNIPLYQYISITPVSKPIGYYTRLSAGAAWRVNPNNGNGFKWTPGQRRPTGEWNQQGNQRYQYSTNRYAFGTELDLQTLDTADFPLQPSYFHMISQQAVTQRAISVATVATDSTNYPSAHVSTASSLAGGFLGSGTGSAPYLMKAIQQAVIQLSKSTGGLINDPSQCVLVTNPTGAAALSRAEETREYMARQEGSIKVLRGDEPTNANRYNIPDRYYGCKILIESTVYNSGAVSPADNIADSDFVWPSNTVLIAAKTGDLVWPEGAVGNPNTITLFEYEAFSAQTKTDDWDRLMYLSISDQYDVKCVSPLTGFLITSAFS